MSNEKYIDNLILSNIEPDIAVTIRQLMSKKNRSKIIWHMK